MPTRKRKRKRKRKRTLDWFGDRDAGWVALTYQSFGWDGGTCYVLGVRLDGWRPRVTFEVLDMNITVNRDAER